MNESTKLLSLPPKNIQCAYITLAKPYTKIPCFLLCFSHKSPSPYIGKDSGNSISAEFTISLSLCFTNRESLGNGGAEDDKEVRLLDFHVDFLPFLLTTVDSLYFLNLLCQPSSGVLVVGDWAGRVNCHCSVDLIKVEPFVFFMVLLEFWRM